MSELITLSKNSPEFESYLTGTFSREKRALPVQTLNVNSAAETVTFRLVSRAEIQRPSLLHVFFRACKIRSLIFVLMPLLLILTKNTAAGTHVDPQILFLTVLGVILAFVAGSLRNDYLDHMKGLDRVLDESGSRVIQKGWLTAEQVKSISTLFLILAMGCAVPLVFAFPILSAIFALALVVGLWAQFQKGSSFKYRLGGEIALFLLLGPLLTVGIQTALTGTPDRESFYVGLGWGWAVLFVTHLRNFVNILPSVQAGFTNTVNWLGFDKSRRLLALWWSLLVGFYIIYHLMISAPIVAAVGGAFLFGLTVPFVLKLKKISSPVGNDMRVVLRLGKYLFLFFIALWVFECLWFLQS